jgi:hypothetical protein
LILDLAVNRRWLSLGLNLVNLGFASGFLVCGLLCGGFLIRLANFSHLDNQSDSEKKAKQNAIRKPLARNDQIRGLFGSPLYAGVFFGDTRSLAL